jgi:hypothetical protein
MSASLSTAKRFVGIATPILISLIGGAFYLTWYAAKQDLKIE